MPRSIEEIIQQADELADRFENHDPKADNINARAQGHSWAPIGSMIGTSGEAARQRYGQPAPKR